MSETSAAPPSDSLLTRSASELAELIRAGELSARELVEQSLSRIEAADAEVNAFTHVDHEGAIAAADLVGPRDKRPFAGVPIAIKDLDTPVAGMPMSDGSDLLGDYVPDHDAAIVRRFRGAGFIIVGKTNTPELGILPVTEPRRFGATRNPWDLTRTPGGSSGGAAAAVAAGMVPVAHGNDGGGSIRIPAACCGLVGLKPSRGRVSWSPVVADSFLASHGVLTRSVRDTASILDLICGYESGDATWAPPPSEPFAVAAERSPRSLRIGLCTEPPWDTEVDPVCLAAAVDAAERLESLGHVVEETTPPWPRRELLVGFTVTWAVIMAAAVVACGRVAGREPTETDVEPLTWWLSQYGATISAAGHMLALESLKATAGDILRHCAPYDAVLTPTLGQLPVPIGRIDSCSDEPEQIIAAASEFTPYTSIANVLGVPAISLPTSQTDDGLPLGIQLVGRELSEDVLLALATQLETSYSWLERSAPPLPPPAAGEVSMSRMARSS